MILQMHGVFHRGFFTNGISNLYCTLWKSGIGDGSLNA